MKTVDAARGKWRGILLALGIDQAYLSGKHGPCPMCEGRDRFRWDNQDGGGGFICNICGAGNGFDLLMKTKGWDFKTAAREVDQIVGNVSSEPVRQKINPDRQLELLRSLWRASTPMQEGDPAHQYLSGRVPLPKGIPAGLRYAPACRMPDGMAEPAMIAIVSAADGVPVNIHRTSLARLGPGEKRKRAMMPGELPDGAAVRLSLLHGERLGIAEGIETALAASHRFGLPVWSAINATMLAKWIPPAGVKEVLIFGDCDPKFAGQAAAYQLAHKLAARHHLAVQVHIPQQFGLDWADSDAA